MARSLTPLPVDSVLDDVVGALREVGAAVVTAPPGAGKTTRIPPALVDAGLVPAGLVMLQPRRVAARAAARRMADERGCRVGDEVGFRIRFENRSSAATRILVVTEGILTRRLQDDPLLEGVDVVVFDEFHLRSVDTDLGLALVAQIRRELRPELKVLVMSATMETGPVASFLGDCPVISVEGRPHELRVTYDKVSRAGFLEPHVAAAVRRVHGDGAGHTLVFLPGAREIRRTALLLADLSPGTVLPLYGGLPAAAQDRAVRPPVPRAVILATNVAETSLTIDGVDAVVDSGLARQPRLDPRLGLDRLELKRIARDAAEQRAGRAARTGPGRVHRCWTEGEQRGLLERTSPEVARVDLCRVVLELRSWGAEPTKFDWFETPEPASLAAADRLLSLLGALDDEGRVTGPGRALLRLPLHPRVARLVTAAHALGCLNEGALAAALMEDSGSSNPNPPSLPSPSYPPSPSLSSDLRHRIALLDADEPGQGTVAAVRRSAAQILRLAEGVLGGGGRHGGPPDALERAVLAAYPDRVVRRRAPGSPRGVMVGGRGVSLSPRSVVVAAPFFVALDVDGEGTEATVHLASEVDPSWLDLHEDEALRFDGDAERVVGTRRRLHGDLVVEEVPLPFVPEGASEVLATAAARDPAAALRPSPEVEGLRARVAFLRREVPDAGLPAMDDEGLVAWLPELCRGCTTFDALRRVDLRGFLLGRLTHGQRTNLDRLAPERLTVPSGAAYPVAYGGEGPPVLAVPIQHLFGLAETPTVAGGRIRVLLHLLAPNGRPAQVTQDLRSFWETGYQAVRRELRGRYPRHAWPDDPWTAQPGARRRRRE